MKKVYLLASMITLLLSTNSFAQVGISSATSFTPDTNSILDASSTTKGVLLPRVALTSTTTLAPITGTSTAPESLFVYNTSTAGTSPNNVTPGFYFWTGSLWKRVLNTDNEAKPMVFYAPSIALDTTTGTHTVDLYLEYKNQFGAPKYSSNVDTPLTTYTVGQLAYFITYIDETVFTSPSLSIDGKLTYTVPATPTITEKTFINVVFKVRN
ncbi:hypothetical protein [Empedobacter sedimenti]|uniref:hypothetical protein n=1 Tax=Empedobacter sedimenti TaxID=3042610 RepID=UPI0024A63DBE|nr:hypothetical protein [Empedobacter sedimenti]